jgi:hypothetical protein
VDAMTEEFKKYLIENPLTEALTLSPRVLNWDIDYSTTSFSYGESPIPLKALYRARVPAEIQQQFFKTLEEFKANV